MSLRYKKSIGENFIKKSEKLNFTERIRKYYWNTECITVVPDSPQYSVMITELSDQDYIGTLLTV